MSVVYAVDPSSLIYDSSTEFLPVLRRAYQANLLYYVLHGLVDGFFNLTLVAYTLFWCPMEQVALRFLLWNIVVPHCSQLLAVAFRVQFHSMAGYTLSMVLFFIVQIAGKYDLLGSPREVSWLSAEQEVMYSHIAANRRLLANAADGGAIWRRQRVGHNSESTVAVWSRLFLTLQQSLLTRDAQPLVVFVVSLLHTISSGLVFVSYINRVSYHDLDIIRITLGLLLLAAAVGLISYGFPPASCK